MLHSLQMSVLLQGTSVIPGFPVIHFWMLPAWFPLGLSFLFCKMEIIPFHGTGLLWNPCRITLMCLDESFRKADLKKHAALIEGFVWSDQDPRIISQDECVCVEPSDNAEHWNYIHVTLLKASTVGAHGRVCCYSFFLFVLCKSFFLLIENTNKKRDDQKKKILLCKPHKIDSSWRSF